MAWKDLLSSTDEDHDPTGSTLDGVTTTKEAIDALDVKVEQNKADITGKLDATAQAVDSALLQGQNGAHYLDRDNHTGQEEITDVNLLPEALDGKVNSAGTVVDGRLVLFDLTTGVEIKQGARVEADLLAIPVDGQIAGLTRKLTPVGADVLLIEDSAETNNKKYVQVGDLPTGTADLTDAQFPTYAGFTGEEDNGTQPTSVTVDFSDNNKQVLTVSGNTAITLAGPAGVAAHYQLRVLQDATGGRAPTITNAYKKIQGSTAPDWNQDPNGETIMNIYHDGGTEWRIQFSKWEAA